MGKLRMTLALAISALLLQGCASRTQAPRPSSDAVAVRQFVQRFYDWYIATALKDTDSVALAHKSKAEMFSPELLRALREDEEAQSKDKEFIVGLDFDPFVAAQDTADSYSIGKVEQRGNAWLVEVRFAFVNSHTSWGLNAKVEKSGTEWRFTNFMYDNGTDLLSVLHTPKEER